MVRKRATKNLQICVLHEINPLNWGTETKVVLNLKKNKYYGDKNSFQQRSQHVRHSYRERDISYARTGNSRHIRKHLLRAGLHQGRRRVYRRLLADQPLDRQPVTHVVLLGSSHPVGTAQF